MPRVGRRPKYPRCLLKAKSFRIALIERDAMIKDVAARAGIHKNYVGFMLRGTMVPLATATRVAKALGKDVTEIFELITAPDGKAAA